jgi:hypothetical protein
VVPKFLHQRCSLSLELSNNNLDWQNPIEYQQVIESYINLTCNLPLSINNFAWQDPIEYQLVRLESYIDFKRSNC